MSVLEHMPNRFELQFVVLAYLMHWLWNMASFILLTYADSNRISSRSCWIENWLQSTQNKD
jgi:hypothetical protein